MIEQVLLHPYLFVTSTVKVNEPVAVGVYSGLPLVILLKPVV